MAKHGIHVDPESVCLRFDRSPTSLIEEPETCENCVYYSDEGLCLREED